MYPWAQARSSTTSSLPDATTECSDLLNTPVHPPPPLPLTDDLRPRKVQAVENPSQPGTTSRYIAASRVRYRAWICKNFGPDWPEYIDGSHDLYLATPILFCNRCGHTAQTKRHAVALRLPCPPTLPQPGTTYYSRLEQLRNQRAPLVPHAALEHAPVPLSHLFPPQTTTRTDSSSTAPRFG